MISVRNLSKNHGDRRVLEGVTAEVTKGETIAIVGPSGGGKSTLLRCLNYLESFHVGAIEIAGTTLRPGINQPRMSTAAICIRFVSSITVITLTSELSLSIDTKSFVIGGSASRSACGRSTWRSVCHGPSPSAREASL